MIEMIEIKPHEPITMVFLWIHRVIRIGLIFFIVVFCLWWSISLLGTVFYRAYVSPVTKQTFNAFKASGRTKDSAKVEQYVAQEPLNLLPLLKAIRLIRCENDDLPSLKQCFVKAFISWTHVTRDNLVGNLVLFFYYDPGLYIDKGFLKPLLLTGLVIFFLALRSFLEDVAGPRTIYQDGERARADFSRVAGFTFSSPALPISALALAALEMVRHYYTQGTPPDDVGVGLLRAAQWTAYGGLALVCCACIGAVTYRKSPSILTTGKITGFAITSAILTGGLLSVAVSRLGATTVTTGQKVEQIVEWYHYTHFERLLTLYFTTWAMSALVVTLTAIALSLTRYGLSPNLSRKFDLYGFLPFLRLLSTILFVMVILPLVPLVQFIESAAAGKPRLDLHLQTLFWVLLSWAIFAVSIFMFWRNVVKIKDDERRRLQEEYDNLSNKPDRTEEDEKRMKELDDTIVKLDEITGPEFLKAGLKTTPGLGAVASLLVSLLEIRVVLPALVRPIVFQ